LPGQWHPDLSLAFVRLGVSEAHVECIPWELESVVFATAMAGSATAAGPTTGSKVHRHLQRFRRPWRGVSGSCRPSLKAAARICLSLDIVFLLFLEGCGGAEVTVMALVSSSEELKSDPVVEESEGSSDSDPCEESCSGPDDRSECLATKRTVFISSSNGNR